MYVIVQCIMYVYMYMYMYHIAVYKTLVPCFLKVLIVTSRFSVPVHEVTILNGGAYR